MDNLREISEAVRLGIISPAEARARLGFMQPLPTTRNVVELVRGAVADLISEKWITTEMVTVAAGFDDEPAHRQLVGAALRKLGGSTTRPLIGGKRVRVWHFSDEGK
jgi:hypothetical protein